MHAVIPVLVDFHVILNSFLITVLPQLFFLSNEKFVSFSFAYVCVCVGVYVSVYFCFDVLCSRERQTGQLDT